MTSDSDNIPEDLRFTVEHEWLRLEGDQARIGITDYAQDRLGDVVFVELPAEGHRLTLMGKLGEIESVKVASELYSPATGEVIEVNSALEATPELVNQDPYAAGWLVVVRVDDIAEADQLLSAQGYLELIKQERGEA